MHAHETLTFDAVRQTRTDVTAAAQSACGLEAIAQCASADSFGDVARGKMRISFGGHAAGEASERRAAG